MSIPLEAFESSVYDDPELRATLANEIELARVRREAQRLVEAEAIGGGERRSLRELLVDAHGLRQIPPPVPLVAGWLFQDSLAWLSGKPGHGKTFVAVDLACSIATGLPWFEHETRQGLVLYVIAEGARGLSQRVDAWHGARGVQPAGVLFLPIAVQLGDARRLLELVEIVEEMKPALVVVDTQARTTIGLEENSARDMGMVVASVDQVRRAAGSCVLVVHHEARAGENLRGSTAIEGAADTIIRASKDGPVIRLENTKQKDAEEAPAFQLALQPIGTSATLTRNLGTAASLMTQSELKALEALEMLGGEASQTRVMEAADLAKASAHRALYGLHERGLIAKVQEGRAVTWLLPNRVPDARGTRSIEGSPGSTSSAEVPPVDPPSDQASSASSASSASRRSRVPRSTTPIGGGTGTDPGTESEPQQVREAV